MKARTVLPLLACLLLAPAAHGEGLSVCVAKNSDFIGQTFLSGAVPKPDLAAVTDALSSCVDWAAKDLSSRNPGKCYIAACDPVALVDGDTIKEILAHLIAQIIGPG